MVIGHPYEPMLAVSGIDYTVKIFSADRRAQHDARQGINIGSQRAVSDQLGLPIGFGRPGWTRSFRRQPNWTGKPEWSFIQVPSATATNESNREGVARAERGNDDNEDEDDIKNCPPTNNGLASRRIHQSYEIMAQNNQNRLNGLQDAHLAVCSPCSEFILLPPYRSFFIGLMGFRGGFFYFILFRSLMEG